MKGRLLAVLLAAVLAAVLLPSALASADTLTFGATYKSDTVNLRSGPTTESTRLGTYGRDTWVQIVGESGNWYRVVAPDGRTGYMSKNYVLVAEENSAYIGIVTNQNANAFLNLRQEPSYMAKVLGIYYNGVPCVLLSESGGWYHVRVNGVEGYFRSEFLRLSRQVYSETVATIVTPGLTGLNLRAGPGKQYDSYKQYAGGRYVMVLQRAGGWCKVSIDGKVGYMDESYLRDGVLTPQEAARLAGQGQTPGAPALAVVTNPKATQVLNLRESATTASTSLAQLRNGERLSVLEQGTEWCRVMSASGLTGFVMTKYVTLINLPATPTRQVTHPQGSYVNLRALPLSYGTVLARVPSGTKLTVVAPGDPWVKVSYGGMVGYMNINFLK